MTESPCISVIVPFFNNELTLAPCIESLLAQVSVGGEQEILLINNGSTDRSPSIAAHYPEVTVLEEPNLGAYAARNTAIRTARSPLLAFTDADCVAASDWLRSILDGMADPAVAVLLGHFRYPASATVGLRLLGAYENAKVDYVLHHCEPDHYFGYANNMAVRASVFEELGLFKEWKRAADSELLHRLPAMRPEQRVAYRPSMRVTHLEFLHTRDRVRRMSLYTKTNSRIETFKELSAAQRVSVVWRLLSNWQAYQ
jgi:glycosyltransferase involved in cell wall biosynthesis